MTQKFFMQGKLKLSQLLDNFVKDQGRMIDAVKQIKRYSGPRTQVRKSHSFDAEMMKQQIDILGSQQNESVDYNTISGGGRQLSIGGIHSSGNRANSSFAVENFSQQSVKAIQVIKVEEDKETKRQVAFQYQIETMYEPKETEEQRNSNQFQIISQEDESEISIEQSFEENYEHQIKHGDDRNHLMSPHNKSEEKIVLLTNKNQQIQQKSKRLSIGEDFDINELDQSDISGQHIPINEVKESSGGYDINYLISDTPLGGSKEINFPEEVSELDKIEMKEEQRVMQLVEDIVNQILLREIRDRLFPQRPLNKLTKFKRQEQEAQILQYQHEQVQQQQTYDILVLDANDEQSKQYSESSLPISNQKRLFEAQKEQNEAEEERRQIQERGIETNIVYVNQYMLEIFDKIKNDKPTLQYVLDNVSQPLYKDPLLILSHLQNSAPPEQPDTLATSTNNEETRANADIMNLEQLELENPIPFQQSVLSVDLYLDIEKERRGGVSISQIKDSFQEENTQSFVAEMENIHNKAIFDAVNEALDGFRPYGLKGPPLPWSKQSKTLTFKFGKEETVEFLLQKVKFQVLEWAHINAGLLGPKQDGMTYREKEQLELMREERLARILISEAQDNEGQWIDYEYEETQAKLDLADIVLNELCFEAVEILDLINNKRKNNIESKM